MRKGIIETFLEIFSDPFFWVLTVIIVSIIYIVYYFVVRGNDGYSEEEAAIERILLNRGYNYIDSSIQTKTGPFNDTNIDPNRFNYRIVQATNANKQATTFWTKAEYRNAQLINILWVPNLYDTEVVDA